jgi:arylsulfatase A-like enzyme
MTRTDSTARTRQPNILILCMDQWQTHMDVPAPVRFPAMERLEAQGVSFDRQYCTVPICTPSRASMWTGVHAKHTGLWDNTNFAWITELSPEIPTIGHLLREQGYYTAFKGKWHLSEVARSEDALERYGFSDYQQWGEMFGAPLQGAQLDGTAVFETVDWLEHRASRLDQPWLLVCSLVNPHDIMFYQSDPVEEPHPNGSMAGLQTSEQRLSWFEPQWDLELPDNFADDYRLQPMGVRHYKELFDLNYGRVPDDREDLWLKRRNYLVNCMRLVDHEFGRILDALDRLDLWKDTVVVFTSDHGEMNGAHRMTQKGAIHFDEAAICNLTICAPDGPQGRRTAAVGSHLDLAPTLLSFAGLDGGTIATGYPHLKGRSLRGAVLDPGSDGPRGSVATPGDGALLCWDGLHSLDKDWGITGALQQLTNMGVEEADPHVDPLERKRARLLAAGERFGAPDFRRRTFFRTVVDGQYKLVRWFSPEEYDNPGTVAELYATGDVTLHDLVNDPGELENLGHPEHPRHDRALVERMLAKLHALVEHEIGEDRLPFDLNMFGTREVRHTQGGPKAPARRRKKVERRGETSPASSADEPVSLDDRQR